MRREEDVGQRTLNNDNVLTMHENTRIIYLKEVIYMATTNLNIRTDKDIKEQAEEIFNELGLNMTTAINMFLRSAVREHGIPFALKLDVPNETTVAAIKEGRDLLLDPSAPRYSSMSALKEALEV